jgi:hypothetical protein
VTFASGQAVVFGLTASAIWSGRFFASLGGNGTPSAFVVTVAQMAGMVWRVRSVARADFSLKREVAGNSRAAYLSACV